MLTLCFLLVIAGSDWSYSQQESQLSSAPISYQYDVLAALSKLGCSAATCHGSPAGKGNFRLSLRGYDKHFDRTSLVREDFGRRTNCLAPEESLLLQKPLMQVPHGGGRKLLKTDRAYEILHTWIGRGCPDDPAGQAQCLRIEVDPQQTELTLPQSAQQLRATAFFSDGSKRDVTDLTSFSSSDAAIASVDSKGLVSFIARGEATVLAKYLDYFATASFRLRQPMEGFVWSDVPKNNYVDELVFDRLKLLQIAPSPITSDFEFLRRVSLDILGILPQRAEIEQFIADPSPTKRQAWIDRLLQRPEYAEFWAQKWGDLLRVRVGRLSHAGVHKFHRWLVAAVRDDMPYDVFVAKLLTSQGRAFLDPPVNFFRAAGDANDCAEATAQLFLGVRIQCAKCHNHPADRWSQDDYVGLASFFSQVRKKPTNSADEVIVWLDRNQELTHPRSGQTVTPRYPGGSHIELDSSRDRRESLAKWLTSPTNPFFAKLAVNRLWFHVMGRGLVHPVDDFRPDNPPSHAELLDELAKRFIDEGYDQKAMLRTILNSRLYQLSSRRVVGNEDDDKYFSHAQARLLSAEQLLDAIDHFTSTRDRFSNLPEQTRATSLPSPDFGNDFLEVFGQPARNSVCACERSTDPKLAKAIQLLNGPDVNRKLRDENGRLAKLISQQRALAPAESDRGDVFFTAAQADNLVAELYYASLCRPPSASELDTAREHLKVSKDGRHGLEDIAWSLLNSKEFLFQH